MANQPNHYLLIVGNREALGWILREQQMAFPEKRSRLSSFLAINDRLLIYTTRGCFNNPSRDRGRVIGAARVTTPTKPLKTPVTFGDRSYSTGCNIELTDLTPLGMGPEFAPLTSILESVPNSWATFIRRALAPISKADYEIIFEEVAQRSASFEDTLPGYLAAATPVQKKS